MPETANQVEIENSHIQSQQLENTLVTAKFKKLNRTVVIADCGLSRAKSRGGLRIAECRPVYKRLRKMRIVNCSEAQGWQSLGLWEHNPWERIGL